MKKLAVSWGNAVLARESNAMGEIAFISYRRADTEAEAKLLADTLRLALSPKGSVFLDSQEIVLGEEWPERVRFELDRARYVLVLIGAHWLLAGIDQWGRRRIDFQDDWVRKEISISLLDKRKTVIPVMFNGTEMPPQSVLPSDVVPITTRQCYVVRQEHLSNDIIRLVNRIAPNALLDEAASTNELLRPVWNRIDTELQKILALAATLAETEGKTYVSTTNFVKALITFKPGSMADFFSELPEGALPERIEHDVPLNVNALRHLESFSPCIDSAMSNLTPRIHSDQTLSSEDVYIDVARYATGKSTQRLRCHGVRKEDVESIVRQLGWELVAREVA